MKTLYQSNKEDIYEVKEEAILADLIDESDIYLERYRVERLVKYLATRLSFTVLPKVELEPELEESIDREEDETK